MTNGKRVCIFVDGENLRHSIVSLFPRPIFDQNDYLPKADWSKLFDWITVEVAGKDAERVRTYWYVVQNIDFAPVNLKSICSSEISLTKLLRKSPAFSGKLDAAKNQSAREAVLHEFANDMYSNRDRMQGRFNGWISIQNQIAQDGVSIEFRRAGAIRFDLLTRNLGFEKAVDVKLATDLIKLKDIYDVAVIVSGDQDYVPAVETIKDYGKRAINVAFLTGENRLLPGGARRLNQATDDSFSIPHIDFGTHLGF